MTAVIKEVDPKRNKAERVASVLRKVVETEIAGQGDELAGFALVTWDGRGDPMSGFHTAEGVISRGFVPTFVRDVLQRHVTMDVVEGGAAPNPILPDPEEAA